MYFLVTFGVVFSIAFKALLIHGLSDTAITPPYELSENYGVAGNSLTEAAQHNDNHIEQATVPIPVPPLNPSTTPQNYYQQEQPTYNRPQTPTYNRPQTYTRPQTQTYNQPQSYNNRPSTISSYVSQPQAGTSSGMNGAVIPAGLFTLLGMGAGRPAVIARIAQPQMARASLFPTSRIGHLMNGRGQQQPLQLVVNDSQDDGNTHYSHQVYTSPASNPNSPQVTYQTTSYSTSSNNPSPMGRFSRFSNPFA